MNIERRPKGGWRIKVHSFTKMIVWFEDGRIRTFYSMDWHNPFSPYRAKEIGLERLRGLAEKLGARAATIEIYDLAKGTKIDKYRNGQKVDVDNIQ